MKEIRLTRGMAAIVDDEDYDFLSKFKWCVCGPIGGKNYYAVRNETLRGGGQRKIYMHRQILNSNPSSVTHHINENTLDNRKQNISDLTQKQHILEHRTHIN